MVRPRRDDQPSPPRQIVTDPTRKAELQAEFLRKLAYLKKSYAFELHAGIDRRAYNAELKTLRRLVDRDDDVSLNSIGPLLRWAIGIKARELAGLPDDARLTEEHEQFVRQAMLVVRETATSLRGKPGKVILRRNVEGLVALLQETTGRRVMAPREKNSDYGPHLAGDLGKTVRRVVDELAPGTTDSELSFWIREAHKKYADNPMRFEDFYPGYRYVGRGRIVPHHRDEVEGQASGQVFSI